MNAFDARSREHWKFLQRQPEGPYLPVLYFEEEKPEGFEESGLYVGKVDFDNVEKRMFHAVAVSAAYHALLYYFAEYNPDMYRQVREDLYLNPSAARNDYAYRYFINATTLVPYSPEKVRRSHKIPNFGNYGRRLLRQVLFEDYEENTYRRAAFEEQ